MKNKVITALKEDKARPHQKYNALLKLYRKHKYANPVAVRNYNQVGFSPENLKTLAYDVQKLYGISDKDLRKKVKPQDSKDTKKPTKPSNELLERLLSIDLEEADYFKEIKPLADDIAKELDHELPDQKKATLIEFLKKGKAHFAEKKSQG